METMVQKLIQPAFIDLIYVIGPSNNETKQRHGRDRDRDRRPEQLPFIPGITSWFTHARSANHNLRLTVIKTQVTLRLKYDNIIFPLNSYFNTLKAIMHK